MSSRRGDVPSSRAEARDLLPSLGSLGVGTDTSMMRDTHDFDSDALAHKRFLSSMLLDACDSGRTNMVKQLLRRTQVDVNTRDADQLTPLHRACLKGNVECARLLLEAGADIVATDTWRKTPLKNACHVGHADCVALLLEAGADIMATGRLGETPLHDACDGGNADCVALLLQRVAHVAIETVDRWGRSPLNMACFSGHATCVELLLAAGASVNPRETDRYGATPLLVACGRDHDDCARLLLEAGAAVSTPTDDSERQTPLHLACQNGSVACARLLLEWGARTDARNGYGETPRDAVHWTDVVVACLMDSAACLRAEKGVPVGGRLSLAWTTGTHALLGRSARGVAVEGALRALLLAEARRAGCALSGDAAEPVLRAVVS
jgi:ankyrin repeat/SOCS box protein 13